MTTLLPMQDSFKLMLVLYRSSDPHFTIQTSNLILKVVL